MYKPKTVLNLRFLLTELTLTLPRDYLTLFTPHLPCSCHIVATIYLFKNLRTAIRASSVPGASLLRSPCSSSKY